VVYADTKENALSTQSLTVTEALDRLEFLYDAALQGLREAIDAFNATGMKTQTSFTYPLLRIYWDGVKQSHLRTRAYGRILKPGYYSTTITRPKLFRAYLSEQLSLLQEEYGVKLTVNPSSCEIPYPFVMDGASFLLDRAMASGIARHFPTTDLAFIGDDDGGVPREGDSPLSHFDALRADFSLARLKHYTGTPVEHFQSYILFTNYSRYADEFIRWAQTQVGDGNTPYTGLSYAEENGKKPQMPAYHLMMEDGQGITLVNIGVGPSNAKTICDHLAVLRPHAWLMIGHCGGLRESQTIGDYVLAHAYLRDDHVLDAVLPPDIPIPSIAEVQSALYDATKAVSGMQGIEVKQRLRTGTVVTTDDRNWELRYAAAARRFSLSRAVAVDMESATIAAQGYRFRVPYGTLLCVSDKPLHGEIKLPGQANQFYDGAISEHLQIGICAIEHLRAEGDRLHSRKLRTFDEPPFR
jgi:AMP nucleosidase